MSSAYKKGQSAKLGDSLGEPGRRGLPFDPQRRSVLLGGLGIALSGGRAMVEDAYADDGKFVFAIIGDYGAMENAKTVRKVADMIKSWDPDYIVTVGDNNYPAGSAETIDDNIGQYFSDYIYPYYGKYGSGSPDGVNRFYPALGDHDWQTDGGKAYFDYFTLPNNEEWYDVKIDPVHLVILETSRSRMRNRKAPQGVWAKQVLEQSDMPWKLVFMHHPPFSSRKRQNDKILRWPFKDWGATSVISGDDHTYERFNNRGIPYFINGLGGANIYDFKIILEESVVRYNEDHGAMRVSGDRKHIVFEFINIHDQLIDRYVVE